MMADARLYLPFNGDDEATACIDMTGRHPTITFVGTAQLDTAIKKFGTAALMLDGDSDGISIAQHADWNIVASASDHWTVEGFIKFTDHTGTEVIIQQREDADNYWTLYHIDGSGFIFTVKDAGDTAIYLAAAGEITDTDWHHFALVKVADEYGLYIDGTQVSYVQDSSVKTVAGSLYIGSRGGSDQFFDGHIDGVRIDATNHFSAAPNVGLTDTITVPTAEYAAWELLAVWPTLTYAPSVDNHVQGVLSDPVHRSESESGAYFTRPRTTAIPRTRTLHYPVVTESDKQLLEDWERETIGYADAFVWTDPSPNDAVSYVARLTSPIDYRRHPRSVIHWQVTAQIALTQEIA